MKKTAALLLLVCLVLSACGAGTGAEKETAPPSLPGTWVNAGQYSAGREFVETMALNGDGSLTVHLDYRGSPYADLEGSWAQEGDTLTFTMSDGSLRVYQFVVNGDSLTLTGNGKTVQYIRQSENQNYIPKESKP